MSEPRPCKRCRAIIQMIEGPNGKPIPAQKVTQVYFRLGGKGPLVPVKRGTIFPSKLDDIYISHFQTCPDADKFSRRKHGRENTSEGNREDATDRRSTQSGAGACEGHEPPPMP